jgi:hypothetical protein
MHYTLHFLFLLLVSSCFASNFLKNETLSYPQSGEKSIVNLAKRMPFSLIDGGNTQFKIDSKDDAERFFSFFFLSQLKINNRNKFKEDLDRLADKYAHVKPLNDLLRTEVNQNGKLISLKAFFRSNGLFFFINDLSPEISSIAKKIESNLSHFYPSRSLKLQSFIKSKFEYKYMHPGNLRLFLSSLLDLIFQRSTNYEGFNELFGKFSERERQILISTIFDIWGESVISESFSIEKINDLRYSPGELEFFDKLVEEDCDIKEIQINQAIRNSFGNKIFFGSLTLIDYMCEFGVFHTLANHAEHKSIQKFLRLLARNIKIAKFFSHMPLLQGLSDINGLGKVLFRYFINSKPQLKDDIAIFESLSIKELTLLREWECAILEYSSEFPTITTNLLSGWERSSKVSLGSIHFSLLELSMDPLQRALRILANLIFDDIFFERDFGEVLQVTVPHGESHFSKLFQMLAKTQFRNLKCLDGPLITKEAAYRMLAGEKFVSEKLSGFLIERAKYFDKIEKGKNQISFVKRIRKAYSIVLEYYEENVTLPKLLEIMIKAAIGKPISEEQILVITSLKGENGGPFTYLIEESDAAILRQYLGELEHDPKELAFEMAADDLFNALVHYPSSKDISVDKKIVNPKTKKVLTTFWERRWCPFVVFRRPMNCSLSEVIWEGDHVLEILLRAQRNIESPILNTSIKNYLNNNITPVTEILKSRGASHFGSQAVRFRKFIESLRFLTFLPHWSEIPNLLFKSCFGLDQSMLSLKYPDSEVREQLMEWQKAFLGYQNDLVNPEATQAEILLALKEIEFTHFELELARLAVKVILKKEYSEISFIKEYQELRTRIKPEIELSVNIEEALEKHGILYALATGTGEEFIARIIKAMGIVAELTLTGNTTTGNNTEKFVRYLEHLEYLKWAISKEDSFLFTSLHNCLFSNYLMRRVADDNDAQIICRLNPENRRDLGIWQSRLVGFENGLGYYRVKDANWVKEDLMELGLPTLRNVWGRIPSTQRNFN